MSRSSVERWATTPFLFQVQARRRWRPQFFSGRTQLRLIELMPSSGDSGLLVKRHRTSLQLFVSTECLADPPYPRPCLRQTRSARKAVLFPRGHSIQSDLDRARAWASPCRQVADPRIVGHRCIAGDKSLPRLACGRSGRRAVVGLGGLYPFISRLPNAERQAKLRQIPSAGDRNMDLC